MKKEKILAIDIGSSSVKAGVLDKKGALLQQARADLSSLSAGYLPKEGLADATIWLDAIKKLCSNMELEDIAALCITGHGPSIVPVKKDASVSGKALMWNKKIEQKDYKSAYLPRIDWYIRNVESSKEADFFLGVPEFVSFYLGAEPAMFSHSPDFDSLIWDEASAASFSYSSHLVPVIRTGSIAGYTNKRACALGIPAGIPVIAGASDFVMAIAGCNVTDYAMVCNRAGTSEGINFALSSPCDAEGIRNTAHPVKGLYNAGLVIPYSGAVFEWFRSLSGQDAVPYPEIVRRAGLLWDESWLKRSGPFFFPGGRDATGAADRGDFVGLGVACSKEAVSASLLEALLFMVRDGYGLFSSAGFSPSSVVLCGGQALNELWVSARADALGLDIVVPSMCDAELTGCAAYSFMGLGLFSSLEDACSSVFSAARIVSPSDRGVDFWNRAYEHYISVRASY